MSSRGTNVGVEPSTGVVHRMIPMEMGTEKYGVSLCGWPGEKLQVQPLAWQEVEAGHRCPHCESSNG